MRPRTSSERKNLQYTVFTKTTTKIVPGPGHYESAENLNKIGRYLTTKHNNSKSKAWNPKHSKRFNKSSIIGLR